ncbi:hypothetical protein [Streptomyces sp. NPDC001719]
MSISRRWPTAAPTRTLRRSISHFQRHPELINGFPTETGLTFASHQLA